MRLGEFLHHEAHRIRDGIERSSLQVSRDPKRIRRPVKSYPSRFLPRPSHRHRPGYSGSTRHVARGVASGSFDAPMQARYGSKIKPITR
jgi:hypothetical protein